MISTTSLITGNDNTEPNENAYALGYSLRESGFLEWRVGGWPEPILTIYPVDADLPFDPRARATLSGVGVGFSVLCSPAPDQALDCAFDSVDKLGVSLEVKGWDDEGYPLTQERRKVLRDAMNQALDAFARIGLTPGGPEALKLFEP